MKKRSLRGVNEHFDPIFNAVLPSAGTFQTSPSESADSACQFRRDREGRRPACRPGGWRRSAARSTKAGRRDRWPRRTPVSPVDSRWYRR
ncbi:hypothetical protein EBB56_01420 [Halomonas sp. YLB-10]|nr:hypothetical protein EBB56_01420 [Halomonas sp. YLB-10]